jgi:hypothetical protein
MASEKQNSLRFQQLEKTSQEGTKPASKWKFDKIGENRPTGRTLSRNSIAIPLAGLRRMEFVGPDALKNDPLPFRIGDDRLRQTDRMQAVHAAR